MTRLHLLRVFAVHVQTNERNDFHDCVLTLYYEGRAGKDLCVDYRMTHTQSIYVV
jgi:hypothetical protein